MTDVVMPHLGGIELVRQLRALGKPMKVLYMSGYTGMYFDELGKSDPAAKTSDRAGKVSLCGTNATE